MYNYHFKHKYNIYVIEIILTLQEVLMIDFNYVRLHIEHGTYFNLNICHEIGKVFFFFFFFNEEKETKTEY